MKYFQNLTIKKYIISISTLPLLLIPLISFPAWNVRLKHFKNKINKIVFRWVSSSRVLKRNTKPYSPSTYVVFLVDIKFPTKHNPISFWSELREILLKCCQNHISVSVIAFHNIIWFRCILQTRTYRLINIPFEFSCHISREFPIVA